MKQVKIVIEKTKDNYDAYAENVEGVYGGGITAEEAKESILNAIRLLKKYNPDKQVPPILKGEYELVFKFDTVSLLNYYKGIFTHASLERITGINQKQLQHYSSGLKKPRVAQARKIEKALHKLGSELLAVEL
ncbi:type II toxin-antitoxin system HicB family antitoxin [Foetidibacter luteolus]|uniref:type II toxin-antitoxin system HicB family antitoxin n=1 Tax=Foetidibacter luteolus TaxID=2608880 RepID=UPI00129AB66A|nr:type II toxin-antitoxin system HicB family antitoxin [Foetidibacter luteolus]